MTLIDGKAISEQVKQEIATEVAEIVARGGKRPHLAAILVFCLLAESAWLAVRRNLPHHTISARGGQR